MEKNITLHVGALPTPKISAILMDITNDTIATCIEVNHARSEEIPYTLMTLTKIYFCPFSVSETLVEDIFDER